MTERRIEDLRFDPDGPSRQIHFDKSFPGFGVRLYPSGRKSYVLQYGEARRRKLLTLGTVGVLTLSQARTQARRHLVEIGDGADPVAARRAERLRRRTAETVQELAEAFLDEHGDDWSESHRRDSERRVATRLASAIGHIRAEELTRADVNRLHAEITKAGSPTEANRVRTLIHTIYEWGSEFGCIPETLPNPARRARGSKKSRNKEESRTRYLRVEEAPGLLKAADATGDPRDGVLVRLWLLTGLRKSELLGRRWSDLNLQRATLEIPETKSRRPHEVPLSKRAIGLFKALPRPVDPSLPIFPGPDPAQPLKDLKRPWAKIRRLSGLTDLRIHDLRRTAGTWLTHLAGVPIASVSALLNHKTPGAGVTQIYARPMDEALRSAVDELERILVQVEAKMEQKETARG
jgi:integrase